MKTKEERLEENRQLRKKFMDLVYNSPEPRFEIEDLLDDVQYNQDWWGWYCKEHKLDVKTGKSVRGSSYPLPSNYSLF